jgi:hypothetical protein
VTTPREALRRRATPQQWRSKYWDKSWQSISWPPAAQIRADFGPNVVVLPIVNDYQKA